MRLANQVLKEKSNLPKEKNKPSCCWGVSTVCLVLRCFNRMFLVGFQPIVEGVSTLTMKEKITFLRSVAAALTGDFFWSLLNVSQDMGNPNNPKYVWTVSRTNSQKCSSTPDRTLLWCTNFVLIRFVSDLDGTRHARNAQRWVVGPHDCLSDDSWS